MWFMLTSNYTWQQITSYLCSLRPNIRRSSSWHNDDEQERAERCRKVPSNPNRMPSRHGLPLLLGRALPDLVEFLIVFIGTKQLKQRHTSGEMWEKSHRHRIHIRCTSMIFTVACSKSQSRGVVWNSSAPACNNHTSLTPRTEQKTSQYKTYIYHIYVYMYMNYMFVLSIYLTNLI